jgi:hypothetical protein
MLYDRAVLYAAEDAACCSGDCPGAFLFWKLAFSETIALLRTALSAANFAFITAALAPLGRVSPFVLEYSVKEVIRALLADIELKPRSIADAWTLSDRGCVAPDRLA